MRVPEPECTCYEVIGGGHQMGCPMYGKTAEEIRQWISDWWNSEELMNGKDDNEHK